MPILDIKQSRILPLPFFEDSEAREKISQGWSLINIYHLRELRDFYILYSKYKDKDKQNLFKEIKENILWEVKPWTLRRMDEYKNALFKLNLFGHAKNEVIATSNYFAGSNINEPLSEKDKLELREIYYKYLRFREILSWFIEPNIDRHNEIIEKINEKFIKANYTPLYFFQRNKGPHSGSVIYRIVDNPNIFEICDEHYKVKDGGRPFSERVWRFWYVFIKWGEDLRILSKINTNYTISNTSKIIKYYYFINEGIKFDLLDYLDLHFKNKSLIRIPDLIRHMIFKHGFELEDLKKILSMQCNKYKQHITLQRTSLVFINKADKELYLKEGNSFVSHLILR